MANNSKVIVVTSGKGGVGKTTTSAAFGAELAKLGKKTVIVDFDIGLRNLDLIMGCERRVIFDFVNVINKDAALTQALIKDKRQENLYVLPASQTKDKDALTKEAVGSIINDLKSNFDYVICDSPAGIERGAQMALYFADEAIIVTNPEISSVRDSDRMIGLINSKSLRSEQGLEVKKHLLITRYTKHRVKKKEMLSVEDIQDILALPLLGIIPESDSILSASNQGVPITLLNGRSDAKDAYSKATDVFLNWDLPKQDSTRGKYFKFLEKLKSLGSKVT